MLFLITWIVGSETNGNPAARWHANGVSLDGVNKIEVFTVFAGVIVSETLSDNKEIKAMQMKRVTLSTKNAGVLHHQLHTRIERKNDHFCSIHHACIIRRRARKVEFYQWSARKIRSVNAILSEEVSLEEGSGW